ncbi:hypothetical protein AWB77_04798 [Caballeronia fortuita]|uniref:Uncharacterized protein n=1 Tax=Caballeronia fortuita TaxID=1777138 RepID=A0A158D2J1_9BURK|nr:hypothetical protein [Caballeronia fortuita]SAK88570.1 hypothetical protein AWB77_04798 [Caballeronia fortuita]
MLKYNADTKVIFNNDEAAVAPIREITRDEIPDLIANGAGVDPSANVGEQNSSASTTAGDAQAARDPAAPVTGSDTDADAGKPVETSSTSLPPSSDESANETSEARYVAFDPPIPLLNTADVRGDDVVAPAVIADAKADPGGAGAADLSPTPAAPNLDAQAPASVSSEAVPLDAGGAADAEAGSAEAGEPGAALSASPTGSVSDEHPLTIIGEIEALVRMIGNSAVQEYQRLIQRLADLKNHPQVKDGAE